MRDIIQRHNRLNGLAFSVVEFALIALLIGGFASYYLLHRRFVMALVGWGIVLNCAPVMIIGLRQLAQDRASGRPVGSFWDSKARALHKRDNPHMFRDTMILTIGTLLPFLSLAAVLFEISRQSRT